MDNRRPAGGSRPPGAPSARGTIGWYKTIEYLLDPLIFRGGGGAADALVGGAGVVPEIVVDNLSYTFGKDTDDALTVLQDINLTFATDSFNTIVGTSGCGKSTLLKMMAVLFEPSDGRMTLDGDVIRGTSRRRGMVFQHDAVFPWMTLAKNISCGPRLRGASTKEQAAIEARWISLPRPRSGEMRLTDDFVKVKRKLRGMLEPGADEQPLEFRAGASRTHATATARPDGRRGCSEEQLDRLGLAGATFSA